MGGLIDYLIERGVAEPAAKPLAWLLIAVVMAALITAATYGYDRAVIRTQVSVQGAMYSGAQYNLALTKAGEGALKRKQPSG